LRDPVAIHKELVWSFTYLVNQIIKVFRMVKMIYRKQLCGL
jgi:hypothetical protein